jgi:hypothetical protein
LFSIRKENTTLLEDIIFTKKDDFVTENGYLKIIEFSEICVKIGSKIEKIKIY